MLIADQILLGKMPNMLRYGNISEMNLN